MATKDNLVEAVYRKINYLPKEDISYSLDLILNYIRDEIAQENRVEIRSFGSFSSRKRKKVGDDNLSYNVMYFRMAKIIAEKLNKI